MEKSASCFGQILLTAVILAIVLFGPAAMARSAEAQRKVEKTGASRVGPSVTAQERSLRYGMGLSAGFFSPDDAVSFTYGSGLLFGGHGVLRVRETVDIRMTAARFAKEVRDRDGGRTSVLLAPVTLDAVCRFRRPLLVPLLGLSLGLHTVQFKPNRISRLDSTTRATALSYGVVTGLAWPIKAAYELSAEVRLARSTMTERSTATNINIGGTSFVLGTAYFF